MIEPCTGSATNQEGSDGRVANGEIVPTGAIASDADVAFEIDHSSAIVCPGRRVCGEADPAAVLKSAMRGTPPTKRLLPSIAQIADWLSGIRLPIELSRSPAAMPTSPKQSVITPARLPTAVPKVVEPDCCDICRMLMQHSPTSPGTVTSKPVGVHVPATTVAGVDPKTTFASRGGEAPNPVR